MLVFKEFENNEFSILDTEDNVIESISGEELLNILCTTDLEIQGLSLNSKGFVVDDTKTVLYKPVKAKNSNLIKAKKAKNDEFYTQLSDIEKELSHYPIETFKDKVIYCPMDVAVNTGAILQSQFVKYFQLNAHKLQFKKLICTCLVEKAQGVGEDIEDVQNCYIIERKTVHAGQRKIHSFVSGKGGGQFASDDLTIVGEVSDLGLNYITGDGTRYPVPEHVINQIVTNAEGKQVLVCKPEDWTLELDTKNGKRKFELHKKWYYYTIGCDDAEREVDKASYFFNNDDFWNDLSILPQGYIFADRYKLSNNIEDNKEYAVPCFEDVEGGSVCLYPAEYYDYKEIEYVDYFSHCPEDDSEFGGSGDFRSEYCTKLLQEADIVVTNPPFSLFKDFFNWVINANKKFIILGSKNDVNFGEVINQFKLSKLSLGYSIHSGERYFNQPDGTKSKGIGVRWFTNVINITNNAINKYELFDKQYWEIEKGIVYEHYDNYDAININKTVQIPLDFDGCMGVPTTYLDKHNPELFEIIGMTYSTDRNADIEAIRLDSVKRNNPFINGKSIYPRVIIRHRKDENGKLI